VRTISREESKRRNIIMITYRFEYAEIKSSGISMRIGEIEAKNDKDARKQLAEINKIRPISNVVKITSKEQGISFTL